MATKVSYEFTKHLVIGDLTVKPGDPVPADWKKSEVDEYLSRNDIVDSGKIFGPKKPVLKDPEKDTEE